MKAEQLLTFDRKELPCSPKELADFLIPYLEDMSASYLIKDKNGNILDVWEMSDTDLYQIILKVRGSHQQSDIAVGQMSYADICDIMLTWMHDVEYSMNNLIIIKIKD